MRGAMVTMVTVCGVLLACCGTPAPPPAPSPPPAPPVAPTTDGEGSVGTGSADEGSVDLRASPVLEKIRERGMWVGLRSDAPDFATREDFKSYSGFDVEMARVIAAGLGLDPQTQVRFRWLPSSMIANSVLSDDVELQLGGISANDPDLATAGPYAVASGESQFVAMRPGDDVLRETVQEVLDRAAKDGSWQRAYDTTLAKQGIEARPR